jgi:SNF2 family DNA or RNA helicase
MKWLVINTESFSPTGLKKRVIISPKGKVQKADVSFEDLPWVVRKFLSVFKSPFIILDECSKCKVNVPMKENDKSSRTRLIKLLNKFGDRMIMTGTLMSKSPLNVMDPFEFLQEGYFPESMYEFAEKYCVMMTIHVGRGRRVLIGQKDYKEIRTRLKNAYIRGGEGQLEAAKCSIYRHYHIDHAKQEHIIKHRKYTPFLNKEEIMRRIAKDTIFVRREDIFDIKYEKFVKEPIMRPVRLSMEAKRIINELVELGFTDKLVLGKVPALELMHRVQDVCNGFEPVKDVDTGVVSHISLKENAKVDTLMELLEEIDVEKNQVVIWSSRKLLIRACADAFTANGISYVIYDGDAKDSDKEEAEKKFENKEVQVFLANQASGAYGLNCLANCGYMVWMCVDESVEKYRQAMSRILRGQLAAPKFAYAIYAEGSIEERQWEALRVGQELLDTENYKETFMVV